ncbi:hypothetical protein BV25DRAFT_1986245 [Artomyces pyxidatus]|uniref:Uncharacterized protein n=1 Tax=Artomyces pyxidatus TaxID=48021 RepID=A0ACB8TJV1_9AGAM|nr:hypothetical protein BV25DRAFT_1986245 [Artomyces pyxidatus]
MPKYLELSRLPKSPTVLKSVNFRLTTPGSGAILALHHGTQESSDLFDPKHPAANLPLAVRRNICPKWRHTAFNFFAFPKAFMSKPEIQYTAPYILTPYPEKDRDQSTLQQVNMSLGFLSSRSRLVLSSVIRHKIRRRIRTAISLVVTRGATAELDDKKNLRVIFNDADAGAEKWLVPDWAYIVQPTNACYQMPIPEMISLVRQALEYLRFGALKLDYTWEKDILVPQMTDTQRKGTPESFLPKVPRTKTPSKSVGSKQIPKSR